VDGDRELLDTLHAAAVLLDGVPRTLDLTRPGLAAQLRDELLGL
jgi:hypothetical protein